MSCGYLNFSKFPYTMGANELLGKGHAEESHGPPSKNCWCGSVHISSKDPELVA